MTYIECVLDVDPISDVGQVQGHEEAVPGPEGAPQHTVISAPLLQSHVSLRPQGQNYPQITTPSCYMYISSAFDRCSKVTLYVASFFSKIIIIIVIS